MVGPGATLLTETAALVRALIADSDVPVMILTACRDVRVLQGVAPFRICDYCVKPRAPGQLATRIWTLLHLRAAGREWQKLRTEIEIIGKE